MRLDPRQDEFHHVLQVRYVPCRADVARVGLAKDDPRERKAFRPHENDPEIGVARRELHAGLPGDMAEDTLLPHRQDDGAEGEDAVGLSFTP